MEIKLIYTPDVLTYGKNQIFAEFEFLDEGISGTKTAFFEVNGTTISQLLDDNNKCEIPEECFSSKVKQFKVGVIYGDLITTNKATITYVESCYTPNSTVTKPTEDIYIQIINKLDEIETKLDNGNGSNVSDITNDYVITNEFAYSARLKDYNNNGSIINGKCSITTTNDRFFDIPFEHIHKSDNSFYTPDNVISIVDKHINLTNNFCTIINKVRNTGFLSLSGGQSWVGGFDVRLIVASPDSTFEEIHGLNDEIKNNPKIEILGYKRFVSTSLPTDANYSDTVIAQDLWSTAIIEGVEHLRNGYNIYLQVRGDYDNATIVFDTALSNVTSTFVAKKFYDINSGKIFKLPIN